jgi:hypothetical protein
MRTFLMTLLMVPILSSAQDLRFVLEERCMSTGTSLAFKCRKHDAEFTIKKIKEKYVSLNTRSGRDEDMTVLQDDEKMLVLQEPVGYAGTSILHITKSDNNFYWVQVAYSSTFRSREITIESGKRVR